MSPRRWRRCWLCTIHATSFANMSATPKPPSITARCACFCCAASRSLQLDHAIVGCSNEFRVVPNLSPVLALVGFLQFGKRREPGMVLLFDVALGIVLPTVAQSMKHPTVVFGFRHGFEMCRKQAFALGFDQPLFRRRL